MKTATQHDTKWTVVYVSGAIRRFGSREAAAVAALNEPGVLKIVPPLYQ